MGWLSFHTVWQALTHVEGETAAFGCSYPATTWYSHSPQFASPRGSTTDVFRSSEIHEDRDDGWCHPSIYVPSLIWMMIHRGREVTGLETLLTRRHAVQECRSVCECLRSWSGGWGWRAWGGLLCGAHHLQSIIQVKRRRRALRAQYLKQSVAFSHQQPFYWMNLEIATVVETVKICANYKVDSYFFWTLVGLRLRLFY